MTDLVIDHMHEAMNRPFTMPAVEAGTPVLWWATGDRNTGSPFCGTVIRTLVNSRMVEMQLTNGHTLDGVRHADDPKLTNPELREEGCWDFAPSHKALVKRIEALEKSMTELQDQLTRKSK